MFAKKLFKAFLGLLISISLLGVSSQLINADYSGVPLGSAEVKPTSPIAKKGQKIFVIIKDTKRQTVPVVNSRNKNTGKKVKMGTTWKVRAVKKVKKTRIYKISPKRNRWLRNKDVTKN